MTRLALCALSTTALLLTACSSDTDDKTAADPQSAPSADAPAPTGEDVCPPQLAEASDKHGFGGEEVASSTPEFGDTAALWACTYNTLTIGTTPEGGQKYGWKRVGEPTPIDSTEYDDLVRGLGNLRPADPQRMCTADLGPRVMLGHVATNGQVTGVVVDLFGCRDVRLTPDPVGVAPGESDVDGVPTGVLAGSTEFMTAVAALSALSG